MADASNDVLMKVVNKGHAIASENLTVFARTMDSLRVGFVSGQFFALHSFSFSVGSEFALAKRKAEAAAAAQKADEKTSLGEKPTLRAAPVVVVPLATDSNSDFVDIQPVEFTRAFDMASTALFTLLVASQTVDSITVVKRKAAGSKNAGEIYLRLDFEKVLLTELKWKENGNNVVETGSFIYRELRIQYRPQRADGSLGSVIPGDWKMRS